MVAPSHTRCFVTFAALVGLVAKSADAFLAQWLERVAVNHKVVGSIPTGGDLSDTFLRLALLRLEGPT